MLFPPDFSLARPEDCRQLAELECRLFSCDRISLRQFRYLSTKANGLVIKVEEETLCAYICAYMVLLQRVNTTNLRIYSIGVDPQTRGRGIARRLLACAETIALAQGCNQLTLEVNTLNLAAISLYRSTGFLPCGERDAYYEDGTPALLMRKHLRHLPHGGETEAVRRFLLGAYPVASSFATGEGELHTTPHS